MIGDAYRSAAIQAVIGPAHSSVIPDVLWGAWLDGTLTLLAMTGTTVSHDDFSESGEGVANSVAVDGGVCPSTVPSYFGIYDAATSGVLVAYAPVTFATAPSAGDPLEAAVGELVFTYDDGSP